MGNLLFSPSGRIGPGQFMSGVQILIIVAVVLAILPALVPVSYTHLTLPTKA